MLSTTRERFPGNNFIFQQDNCPIHRARIVREWMENNEMNVLDWPARSPDLNPVENFWSFPVKKINAQRIRYTTKNE